MTPRGSGWAYLDPGLRPNWLAQGYVPCNHQENPGNVQTYPQVMVLDQPQHKGFP